VRPQFRARVLVFDPADPVFGGTACLAGGCGRTARYAGMCRGHHQRWVTAGRPDLDQLSVSGSAPWLGHAPLSPCRVPGCGFGAMQRGLCSRHARAWYRAGRPDVDAWLSTAAPAAPGEHPACLIGYRGLWVHAGSALCYSHHHCWKEHGSPDLKEFARKYETPAHDREQADLEPLPRQLRLELQYALQCRHDENMIRTRPSVVRSAARWLAASGAASLLDHDEQGWRDRYSGGQHHAVALLIYARRKIAALAEGEGWDNEYPRDVWRLRRLGIESSRATVQFGKIRQPWLKELAKRWTRWRLSTGLSVSACYLGVQAVIRFSEFLGAAGIQALAQVDREILERYLARLSRELGGRTLHREHISMLSTFLQAIRRHGWDASLPPSAMFYPEDYPRCGERLPRALAEHVMAQVEDPATLDRWDNPADKLITVILIRCGLRISDAAGLPSSCIARDPGRAPYLRYYNRKMKREALVPVDEELPALISQQQARNRQRWPGGTPVLFPRPTANIDGTRPVGGSTGWRPN
jgi:integrase